MKVVFELEQTRCQCAYFSEHSIDHCTVDCPRYEKRKDEFTKYQELSPLRITISRIMSRGQDTK